MPLTQLLTKGYFPRELPPPFNSRDMELFGNRPIPASWKTKSGGEFSRHCELERYNHRRVGHLRRRLAFPNPILFYHTARCVAAHWRTLRRHLGHGTWSGTRPTLRGARFRSFATQQRRANINESIAGIRQTARYILKADIAQFYPSIYTHSVAWALHGKAAAKRSFAPMASLGNQLDYWIRMGQGRQTVGVPIGPDPSWIISELITVSVEQEFARRHGSTPPGYLMVDDFELTFKTLPEAEQAMADLEAALNHFELTLNPKKTKIYDLPQAVGTIWTEDLSGFVFRPGRKAQATDLVRYFNLAFELASRFPEDHVIKYAVSRLRTLRVVRENWPLFQSFVLQCMTNEPGSIPFVEREMRRQRARGHVIDRPALSESIETLITLNAPLGRSAEVSWALWMAILFDAGIGSAGAASVGRMSDTAVALTALHAEALGLFATPPDHSVWEQTQTVDGLWAENWLLAYEANLKGWLPSHHPRDHVDADTRFKELKKHQISFYDAGLAPAPVGVGRVRLNRFGYAMDW